MKYVLVSLVGDDATRMNDEFAVWFAINHPPLHAFHEEHPDHRLVRSKVMMAGTAIVMGHDGGGSIRATSNGPVWATSDEFAQIFAGTRVWAYACSTRSRQLDEDLNSLGRKAKEGGVAVFAGHASAITAPLLFGNFPKLGEETRSALARGFRCFLLGCNNAKEIRNSALRGRGRGLALTALPIEEAFESLRVL